jgi:hypothetical protein
VDRADEAAGAGNFTALGLRLWLLDSVTEAVGRAADGIVVSGSHGGLSAARFALQAAVRLVVFNDAGVGKDAAGIAALPFLQAHGIAAVAVGHDSARIGEARSTLNDGIITALNAAAVDMGARIGLRLHPWLAPTPTTGRLSGS